jgi:hypothetical protein
LPEALFPNKTVILGNEFNRLVRRKPVDFHLDKAKGKHLGESLGHETLISIRRLEIISNFGTMMLMLPFMEATGADSLII